MIILDRHRDGIRKASNYRYFRDDLLRFDEKRFRGLGEENTANFVSHAVNVCDAHKLYHYSAVLQVMKAMCFLGSYMLDDPRLQSISQKLNISTRYGDVRAGVFHEEVKKFIVEFGGARLENYRTALTVSISAIELKMPPREARRYIFGSLPSTLQEKINSQWREWLILSENNASTALGWDDDRLRTFCLCASTILGHGFYKDPLYPWVRDLSLAGASKTSVDKIMSFSLKRMKKQVESLELYYGV